MSKKYTAILEKTAEGLAEKLTQLARGKNDFKIVHIQWGGGMNLVAIVEYTE